MSFKVLIAEPEDFTQAALATLQDFAEVTLFDSDHDLLKEAFTKYDAIWIRLRTRISSEIIGENPRTKVIATATTGLDHIDLDYCGLKNIQVLSLKGESEFLKEVRATAEHSVALTLALLRHIPQAHVSAEQGTWNRDLFRGQELYQKTAGIVGLGRLGLIVAQMYQAFGMTVIAYDPFLSDKQIDEAKLLEIVRVNSLEEIASQSDVVSLHVVFEKETENLISDSFFTQMKKNAVLINTSRGGIVDEESLLDALKNQSIAGAALDVLSGEPHIDASHSLVRYAQKYNNLILTPHIGGNTAESFVKTEVFIAEKIRKYVSKLSHPVS